MRITVNTKDKPTFPLTWKDIRKPGVYHHQFSNEEEDCRLVVSLGNNEYLLVSNNHVRVFDASMKEEWEKGNNNYRVSEEKLTICFEN